jgi:fused signal recognition particle receptor
MLKRIWKKVKSLNLRDILSKGDESVLEELEERFITADFGMDTTIRIIDRISSGMGKGDSGMQSALIDEVHTILTPQDIDTSLHDPSTEKGPSVFLVVGVNGTGKTTTCAKLASKFTSDGFKVLLVAADTFRAGASEQLKKWSDRLGCEFLGQKMGSDPASVLYDGIEAARSRGIDVVLCDTAGRLHTERMLMEELKKILRVSAKLIPSAPHEVLLVLDATTGQNAIRQARIFHEALGLTGIALCKMDGTSKGGIVVSIVDQLRVPVKLLGVGEKSEDLLPFEPLSFTSQLLGLQEAAND